MNVIDLIMFYILFLFIVTKNIIEFIFSHSSHRDLSKANLGLEKYKILCFLVQSFYVSILNKVIVIKQISHILLVSHSATLSQTSVSFNE